MLPEATKTREKEIHHPPQQGHWTYDDYARLPDNSFRYEIIRGELHMSPAPRPRHQIVVTKLTHKLLEFVDRNDLGSVITSPIDVLLDDLATPVQPDVIFIATDRLNVIGEQTVEGAPDLIVEVLSPGSARYDRQTKYQLYAEAGVREYWLVEPDTCVVEVHVLRGQAYALLDKFGNEDAIQSEVLPELRLPVAAICPTP